MNSTVRLVLVPCQLNSLDNCQQIRTVPILPVCQFSAQWVENLTTIKINLIKLPKTPQSGRGKPLAEQIRTVPIFRSPLTFRIMDVPDTAAMIRRLLDEYTAHQL